MFRSAFRLLTQSALALGALLLAGCSFNSGPGSEPTAAPSPTASRTLLPEVTATATLPDLIGIVPALTATPAPPTATPTITPTPGPFEHVVQPGDTLLVIVQQYGHRDLAVLQEVVAMNPNVPNADRLPPPGSTILIPRPTATAIPPGGELTATFIAQNPPTATPELLTMNHIVEENQSIVGIALQYDLTVFELSRLNPTLDWRGCDFSSPSGGEDCAPLLSVGQEIVVFAPTLTPTLSPTPSGSETPTPVPTYGPVRLLWPSPGDIISGGPLTLRWVSAGALRADEIYQVNVFDRTANVIYTQFTRENILTLPPEVQPTGSTPHDMTWQVVVARVRDDHTAVPVGACGEERPFRWTAP